MKSNLEPQQQQKQQHNLLNTFMYLQQHQLQLETASQPTKNVCKSIQIVGFPSTESDFCFHFSLANRIDIPFVTHFI